MEKSIQTALENFIIKMEDLPAVLNHPGTGDAMREVCELLRIAKVTVVLTETPGIPVNTVSGERVATCYDTGDADESRYFSYKKTTGEGNKAEYYIYPKNGAPAWTEEEKFHLQSFVTILYVFNGRSRVMTLVDRLTYRDGELHMYNLNYFLQQAGTMIARKRAVGYVACRFNIRGLGAINKQLGRNGGTKMMRHFIKGLELMALDGGVVGRMGGDNFVALFKKEMIPR